MPESHPRPESADPERTGAPQLDGAARAALARLELTVTRKLDGMLFGDHRGLVPGPGSEPGEAREYQPGDDVRTMDWSVTARTSTPHIRQRIADRELVTWIAVDLSPSIDVESRSGSKRELVLAAIATLGFLAAGDAGRIGMVVAGAGRPRVVRPAAGSQAVRRLLEIAALAESGGDDSGSSGLDRALAALRGVAGRTGLVAVVSDFLGELDWERALRLTAARHEILAVHVADPLDIALPAVGAVRLQDPSSGDVLEVDVDAQLAQDYCTAAAAHRQAAHGALRRCGAPVLGLRTDRDWVRDVVGHVTARRRGGMPTGESIADGVLA